MVWLKNILTFMRNWSLPVSMTVGILSYFAYSACGFSPQVRDFTNDCVNVVQPLLLFCMLYLSFCKINPMHIHVVRWHLWLAALQLISFVGLAVLLCVLPASEQTEILVECAMVCMICPTATAAVVVVDKLGGSKLTLVGYSILSNCIAALAIPAVLPFIHSNIGLTFLHAFTKIIMQVFPLLVVPFFAAWATRIWFPELRFKLLKRKDLAFQLWVISLALAMAVTTRAFMHSNVSGGCLLVMFIITMVCCLGQFVVGKFVGTCYDDRISAGQALGQKNTVFIIWVAATFMNPVVAVTGGFYSIWHNVVNSYQLYKRRKSTSL